MVREPEPGEDILEYWRAAPIAAISSATVLAVACLVSGGWVASHGGWFIVPGVLLMSGIAWVIICAIRLSVRLTPRHVLVYGFLWNRKVPRDRIVKIGSMPLQIGAIPTLHWRTKRGIPVWTFMSVLYPGGGIGYASQLAEENLQKLRTALGNV